MTMPSRTPPTDPEGRGQSYEKDLLARVTRRQPGADEELYGYAKPFVERYMARLLVDQPTRDELTALTLVVVWDKAPAFVYKGKPLAFWTNAICRNVYRGYLRDRKRWLDRHEDLYMFKENWGEEQEHSKIREQALQAYQHSRANHCDSPDDIDHLPDLDEQESAELLGQVLANLRGRYRDVFQLKYLEQRTTAEVAKKLNMSEPNVRQYYHRAQVALEKKYPNLATLWKGEQSHRRRR
jgi:RNA polymerase sigma factor (sigma-70 family)